jgi:CDP-6-deoxy-D-xylo-4-hexulose-3-dehydrase
LTLFNDLFRGDERFVIQRETGRHSSFCFPIVLNPRRRPDRTRVLKVLKDANIGYRIITGGNFLRHDALKYFDHDCVGDIANANTAHDFGFFTGNYPADLRGQIETLHAVLDRVCA